MRKLLVGVFALLALATSVFAEVKIPEEHRIKNRAPGYCGWCCLETLGNMQKITKLKDLAKNRENDPDFEYDTKIKVKFMEEIKELTFHIKEPKNTASVQSVKDKLDTLGVKYKITSFDLDHVEEAVKKNGCVIFTKTGAFGDGGHAVILTEYTKEIVKFIDPNDCCVYVATRAWFEVVWQGTAITLEE